MLSSFPLTTLHAREGHPDWQAIAELIKTWQPGALIVGNALSTLSTKDKLIDSLGNTLKGLNAIGESLPALSYLLYHKKRTLITWVSRTGMSMKGILLLIYC